MEPAKLDLPHRRDEVVIVPYNGGFRDDVARLWDANFSNAERESYYRDIDASVRTNPGLFWIATIDDALAGTCVGAFDGHRSWIYYLCVATGFRRRGIGTMLLRHVEARLLDNGASQVGLHVYSRRQEVVGFYRARGYFVEESYCMGKRLP